MTPRSGSFRRPVAAAAALLLGTVALGAANFAQDSARAADGARHVQEAADGKYIVQLDALPTAGYDGSIAGLARSQPAPGAKFDAASAESRTYAGYLGDRRAEVLDEAGISADQVLYEFDTAVAGFAADLSYDEARTLAATPGVRAVHANETFQLDTSYTPTFLGLDEPEVGLWDQLGGPTGVGGAGEDMVVGVIDTGFSPTSESFAPLDPAPATAVPDGWLGTCDAGDPSDMGGGAADDPVQTQPAAIECDGDVFNSKVIGARYFAAGVPPPMPGDFVSPKDYDGHGSHTASTAAGNYGVPATIAGHVVGNISGMAPRARIAVYKVCWDSIGCTAADITAAIDASVADGVDVLNFSISGPRTLAVEPIADAFRTAAQVGIFVAVSAGNEGPGSFTVAHNYPWVNTTAASTVARMYAVDVFGEGEESWTGSGIGAAVPASPSIYAANAAADGAAVEDAARCFPDTLDADLVAGNIVVCDRGVNARTEKSAVVGAAGGIGMVLANDALSGGSVVAERHSVPTAHVTFDAGVEIKDYVGLDADNDVTLELGESEEVTGDSVTAPEMASFSSRGPGQVAEGDLLKPDITAPGVGILASVANTAPNFDEQFGFLSGTSMASPHIAGIGALLRDAHPDWSPAAIKSSIVTTGYQQNNQGDPIQALDPETGTLVDATPFEYGGGHVDPQGAAAVPAVYDSGFDDWAQFLCGADELPADDSLCESAGSIDPSDLNYPSLAIGDLGGTQTVTRTLTNVTDGPLELTSEVALAGIDATVTPAALTIAAGGSADFTVEFTRTDAPLDAYAFGALTWTDASDPTSTVRSPIAIRPVAVGQTESLLVGAGSTGEVSDMVRLGTDTPVNIRLSGLEPAQVDTATLSDPSNNGFPADDPMSCFDDPECAPHAAHFQYEVPEGARLFHSALFAEDYVSTTDLDMYVYVETPDGLVPVADSLAEGIAEHVSIPNPDAGTYHVFIELYSPAAGEESVDVINYSWAVTSADIDDFSVEPGSLEGEVGSEQAVTFSWTDLANPAQGSAEPLRYLGLADYRDGEGQVARTVVRVDVGPAIQPTTTLPPTGAGDASMLAALGLGVIAIGAVFVAVAARRLREVS